MSGEHLANPGNTAHAQDVSTARRGDTSSRWLAFLLSYGVAYLLVRLAVPGTLERDEAEIVYLTQELRLGYGTQPPLYAWLQWLAFAVFGVNRFGLLIPKIALLIATYICMFRAARPLVGAQAALAAAASLALFPQIGWESLRIQTHSVLVTTLACATLWCYRALLGKPGPARHAVLGLLIGLGLQAKYNFGVFLAGVAMASLLVREHRQVLWTRRMWLTLLVAVLVLLPHAGWMTQHPDAAFAGTLSKMRDGLAASHYLRRVADGLLDMSSTVLAFAALPAFVFAVLAWPWRAGLRFDGRAPDSRFFLVLLGTCLAQLVALALTGEVGTLKDRWMIPLLFTLPLAALVLFPGLRRPAVCARLLRVAAGVALFFLLLLPARIYLGPALGRTAASHHPYPQLAAALQQRCPSARTVVTGSLLSAGNLRFARPALRTVLLDEAPGGRMPLAGALAGEILLVTHANEMPRALADFQARHPGARLLSEGRLDLELRFGARERMTFDYGCFAME